MCTIGWVRCPGGFILFKNRDALKASAATSKLFVSNKLIAGSYKGRNGIWIGVNKYGIGFASALGPYRKHKRDWRKVNELGEAVLLLSQDLGDALEKFLTSFREEGLNTSANVILANKNKAYLIELLPGKSHVSVCEERCVATNHFRHFEKANRLLPSLESSVMRLVKVKKLLSKASTAEEIANVLSYQSNHPNESICRTEKVMTVSSLVIEFKSTGARILYAPGPPCSTPFAEIEWKPRV